MRRPLRAAARLIPSRPARVALAVMALVAIAAAACAPNYMSANVGVVVPAPWGGVTVGTAVPIGYGW